MPMPVQAFEREERSIGERRDQQRLHFEAAYGAGDGEALDFEGGQVRHGAIMRALAYNSEQNKYRLSGR